MKRSIPIQFGLFGGSNEIAGLHVVSAHTRILEDGSEVHVPEHVRWNRGRKAKNTGRRARKRSDTKQASLFGAGANEPLQGQLALWESEEA